MAYCKIYIDSDADKGTMVSILDGGVAVCFERGEVEGDLFRNEVYRRNAPLKSTTYPVDRSRYYVEIDAAPDASISEEEFRIGVSKLIIWLRERADFVVASCDFEDYVVKTTG